MAEERVLRLPIVCGATTCSSTEKPGQFCRYVRTSHMGARWSYHIYAQDLEAKPKDVGWLQRLPECLWDAETLTAQRAP